MALCASVGESSEKNHESRISEAKEISHTLDLLWEGHIFRGILDPKIAPVFHIVVIAKGGDICRILHKEELQVQKVLAVLLAAPRECVELGIYLEYQAQY